MEFQLIQSIYEPDEDAFDALIQTVSSIDNPIGHGRGKWTPLMFCVHKKRDTLVAKLLDMGANPNTFDQSTKKSCLHTACTNGYGRIVRLLLQTQRIGNINLADNEEGESPLFAAVKKSRKFCVELLLNHALHGQVCDINIRIKTNGQTPLFIACDKGDIEIVRLLLDYKYMRCDLNAVDQRGYTALMKAVAKGHDDVVRLLLNVDSKSNPLAMPDVNLTNNWSQCATMLAVRANNLKMTKLLLNVDENADVLYRKDWKERTILDQCVRYHIDKKIVEYVKKLLYTNIHSVINSINTSKDHDNVPYLPSGIVNLLCNMTY